MACPGCSDWIVPRRLMCFLFWTGTVLLFAGILLIVTSKHKGNVFLWWGGVLLGLGSCVLLSCLILCIHAYYVISESRSNAEHALINNLTLQRKAQYSAPVRSTDVDGVWGGKEEPCAATGHGGMGPNSNGGYTEFRYPVVTPRDDKLHFHYRTFPSEREEEEADEEELERDARREAERFSRDAAASSSKSASIFTVTQASRGACFSGLPPRDESFHLVPPPSYSQLSPPFLNSSTAASPGVKESAPLHASQFQAPPGASTAADGMAPESPVDGKSRRTKIRSASPHLKNISVEFQSRKDQTHQHPHLSQIADARNASSQSSVPNSSTEFELETTDFEVGQTRPASHHETRLLNNTPVDDIDPCSPAHALLARRPARLNFEPAAYDTDRVAIDASATWRIAPTLPMDAQGVAEEPRRTPGSRRHMTSESITRPFGHGTVTVTPLYRTPKTPPPSGRHRDVAALGAPSKPSELQKGEASGTMPLRSLEGQKVSGARVRTPEAHKGVTIGSRPPVPTVSVTPCIGDRETDIGVCQSDVTVYDNVMDTFRV